MKDGYLNDVLALRLLVLNRSDHLRVTLIRCCKVGMLTTKTPKWYTEKTLESGKRSCKRRVRDQRADGNHARGPVFH